MRGPAKGVRWCMRIKCNDDEGNSLAAESFAEVGVSCRGPLITIRAGAKRSGGSVGVARISVDAARALREALDEAIAQLDAEAVP